MELEEHMHANREWCRKTRATQQERDMNPTNPTLRARAHTTSVVASISCAAHPKRNEQRTHLHQPLDNVPLDKSAGPQHQERDQASRWVWGDRAPWCLPQWIAPPPWIAPRPAPSRWR
eukprot:TRINITY_DN2162_c0_g6_i1.p4 TRINITY_DN2162_c0_g6~~TRINITY_DN2162_c0_g6_i1.p4  ORF type:complete len:118 (-),score=6.79 TRINITY_DN2162_c0_g6_i1:26-379(-)